MSDLTQRLREHAALHGDLVRFNDEQAQWERDLLDAADYIDNDEAKGVHSCHDHCQRLECVQRREIERLRSRLAELEAAQTGTIHESWQHRTHAELLDGLQFQGAMTKALLEANTELESQLAEVNAAFEAEQTEKWKMAGQLAEAELKYEERVRQHEEYIAFADEEITGLIEAKRMVLVKLAEAERNEGTLLGMIHHQRDVLRECLPYINESMAGRRPGRCADDIRAAVKALTADSGDERDV